MSAPASPPKQGDEYNAANLQVLEGLDAVRKRPGMYIGSTDSRGLQHCLWEIIDNSVDEAIAGHCNKITVTLHNDDSVEVSDNGRGIPVDVEPKTGLPGVVVVLTKLHAGGKFGGGSYAASGGLHGVGASVVNALSVRLDASVFRGGQVHSISFAKGEPGQWNSDGSKFTPGNALNVTGRVSKSGPTGTTVRYWPDRQLFERSAQLDLTRTHARARQTAFLVPGLEISVVDARGETHSTEVFKFEGGTRDFVDFLATDRAITDTIVLTGSGTYTETVPMFNDAGHLVSQEVERTMGVEVALRWGVGYDPVVRSFVNIVETPKGGSHISGFDRAMKKTINEALKSSRVQKSGDEPVEREDLQEGLTAVVTVRIAEPQFEGQTKEILGTSAASSIVAKVVGDGLRNWLGETRNKSQAKGALEKINQAMRTRKAARLHKETARRKNALESSSLPAKLADCRSEDVEVAELFIIEGDSAAGTLKGARDSEYQALLPVRGKILNTFKATEKQMLDNVECAAIITAMGAGSGKSFDLSAIRYGKLIALADADVDGSHIRCLLLTLCYRYMRPLLQAGHVYAAMPPLHQITLSGSGENLYTYTAEELEAKLLELERAGKKVREVSRYKGLGEMSEEQLAVTTVEKATRKLRRMTMEDAEEANLVFEMLMGKDVAARKEFITEQGGLLDPERLDI